MMLGYRTVFEVPSRRNDVEIVALSQLRSWLQTKRLDADALVWGERVPLSASATGFLQELDGGDDSRSVRARIVENANGSRWTSTLTVHVPGDQWRDPWVWLDIEGPEGQIAGIPRLARSLLEVFSGARADVAHLKPVPELVTEDDVDAVVDVLLDESRRRLVFVAGSDALMPLTRWKTLLGEILRDTVGLASAYVLDAEATAAVNARLGATHAVQPGTVRTFLDHVDPGDALDAQRHRVLTTQRILRGDARTVGRILGLRARAVALQQPLPRAAIRIDRLLERQIDTLVLDLPAGPLAEIVATTDVEVEPAPVVDVPFSVAVPEASPVEVSETVRSSEPAGSVTETAESILSLHQIAVAVLGIEALKSADIDRIIALAQRGQLAEAQHGVLAERLTELQDQVESARDEVDELKQRLEDEQLEVATSEHDLHGADQLVRHLRSLLARTDAAAAAWEVLEPEDDLLPSSFDELISRFDELGGVVLTMTKQDVALALDVHNPLGTWAAKTWQALLALRDYVACKSDGSWTKDVDGYLSDAPSGMCTFSATRHARDESESVKTTSKFRSTRELPVPDHVAESGRVFMGAHFKIAQSGLISPRLHYLDATGVDGKVYVGYIGPHLPTKQTN